MATRFVLFIVCKCSEHLTRNRCHLKCKHLLREGEEAEWTSVENGEINSRREKEQRRTARGNAFTPKELPLAAMATVRILSACARTLSSVCHCGHTHCISQQLVTLLQTSGGCGEDVTLFCWWVASPVIPDLAGALTILEMCVYVRVQLRSVPLARMGPAQVEAPFKLVICFWINLQQAIGCRAWTDKEPSERVKARGLLLPPVAAELHGEEEGGRGTRWDCLRRHIYVRATCHSG